VKREFARELLSILGRILAGIILYQWYQLLKQ
jgi:uncharacterized membrane protein